MKHDIKESQTSLSVMIINSNIHTVLEGDKNVHRMNIKDLVFLPQLTQLNIQLIKGWLKDQQPPLRKSWKTKGWVDEAGALARR